MTAPAYRPCPDGAALNIRGEHFTCDAMRHMHESSATHDGWPHSNMDAEAIWTERAALVTALQADKRPHPDVTETSSVTWTPVDGDYAQKIKHGSNVHIVRDAATNEYGVKVTMVCGASWYSGVLDHVSEYWAQERPCKRCWELM